MNLTMEPALLLPTVLGSTDHAAAERTLVDIFRATCSQHPDVPAIDDGTTALTYRELLESVDSMAAGLGSIGVGRGDRVGIRLPSGTWHLYASILAVVAAGAAYVPVDADDPQERADLIFAEAAVKAVIDTDSSLPVGSIVPPEPPTPDDDAWIIFTSGSTGVPKGVAVTHRSAAAFVDAEARLFVQSAPIAPGDRVLAGLSVAFDASCEEMWLAWRHGACLVPAPRSLVRSGIDLGVWLVSQRISIVSTVPTLAALWPQESLEAVRLLIFGGEACPPELAERLVDEEREVWNTYGPTEATVVACAALLGENEPVRIGLPLDGWTLAVLDDSDQPVAPGQVGQLIIGGVGLARYLDPVKDQAAYAPMPTLGWERAYRSGDLVQFELDGLLFAGRADEQVKIGGRRVELGEVDAALMRLAGVSAAAAALRRSPAGTPVLVGYVVADAADFDQAAAREQLRSMLPAGLVPLLAVVDTLPTRTSGKVDRDRLPWPLVEVTGTEQPSHDLVGTAGWLAAQWAAVLGAPVTGLDDDFFAHGGGSLTAAQLVSRLRTRHRHVTVGDVYQHPRLGDLADFLGAGEDAVVPVVPRVVRPIPLRAQAIQIVVTVLVAMIPGLQWLILIAAANNVIATTTHTGWATTYSWWWVIVATVVLLSPGGRMAIAAGCARLLLPNLQPGDYPRGGSVHLRLWSAERVANAVGVSNLAGAPWISYYARALGAKVGRNADLHSMPPITGLLKLGAACAIEPEVDLSGYWLDGDVLHVGAISIEAGANVGARSTLGPGCRIGRGADVDPGSYVDGEVPADERWAGAPATAQGPAGRGWPPRRPAPSRRWPIVYAISSVFFSLLPILSALPGLILLRAAIDGTHSIPSAAGAAFALAAPITVLWFVTLALATAALVRLLGLSVQPGYHPVRSRVGWQVWATERLLDSARTQLFPLYSSLATPAWLRLLGAEVGRNVEASTVLLQPGMTSIGDRAFLADDSMVGSYEMRGGWLHIEPTKIGKRGFLGNSAIAAPGRAVPKNGLIAVLSSAPLKAKKGSSWLGSPPTRLRRSADSADVTRTFDPSRRLKIARAVVELCRVVPTVLTVGVGLGVVLAFEALLSAGGLVLAALLSGVVLVLAGAAACGLTVAAKWILMGRTRSVTHPLWSGFVWRSEVVDTFVEVMAAPWFARATSGTPVLNFFLRALGARIGRGVWCETYWLPEPDLVRLGDASTVNRGCVVQTHLFHDRIMRMDWVELGDGATLGPHCVVLPAASLGRSSVVGPSSLVMRGETVPDGTRWIGNPIASWPDAHP